MDGLVFGEQVTSNKYSELPVLLLDSRCERYGYYKLLTQDSIARNDYPWSPFVLLRTNYMICWNIDPKYVAPSWTRVRHLCRSHYPDRIPLEDRDLRHLVGRKKDRVVGFFSIRDPDEHMNTPSQKIACPKGFQ